ncbi:MAG: hypothetical protein JW745_03465 [Sedimentisphaerales bacterium]|nr:hypothetical protein [Sedimentisphaerales bacterium]MBN2843642.1 hypothetical protein [Sedimentisphaerales bacterium]
MKKLASMLLLFVFAAIFSGCSSAVGLDLKPGYKDTIKYTKETKNRVWVEMKDKEPSETGRREMTLEYEITREVKGVGADGSMLLALTFDKVALNMTNTSTDKEKKNHYISQADQTSSSWNNEPAVYGVSVQAKLAPNGQVTFVDLDQVRAKLKLSDDDNSTVANLISEKELTDILQRPFQVKCPKSNFSAKSWEEYRAIPDAMLNAMALRVVYKPVSNENNCITVKTAIEPLYVLPEGMDAPPAADAFKQILKSNSDLQEPVVDSEAVIDLATGLVKKDKLNVTYLMIVDGNKLFPDQRKDSKADAGMMYIEIVINEKYEIE